MQLSYLGKYLIRLPLIKDIKILRVLFSPGSCIPFHANTLQVRPLGGTESSVIRLAEALQSKGVDAYITTPFENPPLTSPRYIPEKSLWLLGGVDLRVVIRDWRAALARVPTKLQFFWSGDAYDQPINIGIGDKRIAALFHKLLAVSEWQKETTSKASGFPEDKISILRNGIHLPFFEKSLERKPYRLIYTSTPYRGLIHLVNLFPKIREAVPEAELIICSGYEVYADNLGRADPRMQKEWEEIRRKLSKIDGITIKGNLKQEDLAKELLQASLLAYPNTFAETSCISVLEAQAAGCVPVTTRLGALPETVSDAGVLIDGLPGEEDYFSKFVFACVDLLKNQSKLKELSVRGINKTKSEGWDSRAETFLTIAEALLGNHP